MNPSPLIASPSSSSRQSSLLGSPFLNPTPLYFTRNSTLSNRRRFRISVPRCSSASSEQPSTSTPAAPSLTKTTKELKGIEVLVDKLSPPVRLASSAIIFAGAVDAGYGLGSRFGGSRNAALGGAVALGAAGGATAYALNACARQVAAVNLHNYVAGFDDPAKVTKEEIESIANRYGVNKQDEAFKAEICDIYSQFLSFVLSPGGQELKGDEVDRIVNFKNALGIDDPDAAAMHMEIGRKIYRQRLEVGDRDADIEQRRLSELHQHLNQAIDEICAFQKLIYVSNLVFGEASSFLLPWKRVFKVTDSQVEVAIRDNAQRLYASRLKSVGRDIDAGQLVMLREAQCFYHLSDELAGNLFREHTRKLVEVNISVALSILKSRTRAVMFEELDKILAFNDLLILFKNHSDVDQFAHGVGPISLLGGDYDGDRKMEDLKLLYRAYVTDSLSTGCLEDSKLTALNQLRNIFGLGKREAEAIILDVTSKVYGKRLQEAVSGGELEMADSKAAFLQNICDELHFDPQKASGIHEEMYWQKLQQCVADGELSEEDISVAACLKRLKDAIASGVDGYDADVKNSVRKAAHGLRLTRETAMSIASKAVRKIFINYIKRARAAGRESADTSIEEPVKEEVTQTEDEEWDYIQTLRKIKPDKELLVKLGKPGQTEINLSDDLPERDRTDLYKTYLLFCITGEVTKVPFGAQITTKKDDSEYVLNQLGGILGMSGKEIVEVHRSLAEQAFRQQAEVF
ncbi:hypothetical protein L6164_030749 [Bauhinia variegata]|uniref:Uncharacterized protein n=1 Tax=Bauhinia variegata TaxID=167791 RepID=A0ACB9LD55_BAUVA|nr:hypothetical protein L6164_030749 [Bauhinia variegata]